MQPTTPRDPRTSEPWVGSSSSSVNASAAGFSTAVVYDLPPGSSPILHRPHSDALATTSDSPAQNLPEPGIYILSHDEHLITLASHGDFSGGGTVRFISSREEAAAVVRAFGGDPAFLDSLPDTQPQTDTNQPLPPER